MACFTLTKDAVALLAQAAAVGMEGAPDGVCMDDSEYEAIEALLAELDACTTDVEITVMRIEEAPTYEFTDLGDSMGLNEDDVASGWSPRVMLIEEAPEADRDRWN